GWIAEVGSDVAAELRVGDLVAVDPSLHCGSCDRCRVGRRNLCRRWGAVGATQAGAWADYVAVPERTIYRLDDGYPVDVASLIEPVACALRGLERLGAVADTPAIIYGAGTMGILLTIMLDLQGVGPIHLVERNDRRRAIAGEVTAATVVSPEGIGDLEAASVIDATGNPVAIASALDHVAPGGTFMVFGVAGVDDRVPFSPFAVYQREIRIVGSMAILNTFGPAIDTIARHADAFRPLATHTFPLAGFGDALDVLRRGDGIKVTIGSAGGSG
ncbi:MAG: alcohol dehydrogenase catalytic domain-containing protein, partial [Chloroflexi bacterium]|nr:alcohol dehydrogenase catalytic domain-containing protein [Chloroflexota bacterium]